MAVTVMLETAFGETRETYVRVNSLSTNNHGETSAVLFRGYISQEAFKSRSSYTWEKEIHVSLDVSENLWQQAYKELKRLSDFVGAVDC